MEIIIELEEDKKRTEIQNYINDAFNYFIKIYGNNPVYKIIIADNFMKENSKYPIQLPSENVLGRTIKQGNNVVIILDKTCLNDVEEFKLTLIHEICHAFYPFTISLEQSVKVMQYRVYLNWLFDEYQAIRQSLSLSKYSKTESLLKDSIENLDNYYQDIKKAYQQYVMDEDKKKYSDTVKTIVTSGLIHIVTSLIIIRINPDFVHYKSLLEISPLIDMDATEVIEQLLDEKYTSRDCNIEEDHIYIEQVQKMINKLGLDYDDYDDDFAVPVPI